MSELPAVLGFPVPGAAPLRAFSRCSTAAPLCLFPARTQAHASHHPPTLPSSLPPARPLTAVHQLLGCAVVELAARANDRAPVPHGVVLKEGGRKAGGGVRNKRKEEKKEGRQEGREKGRKEGYVPRPRCHPCACARRRRRPDALRWG